MSQRVDPSQAALIGVDWGSSSLRAYLIAADGAVIAERREPRGVLRAPDFEQVLASITREWPRRPMLACGMVGSTRGWVEVPYVSAPAGVDELARGIVRKSELHIVPGVAVGFDGASPNVMRGEETQIIGAEVSTDLTVILPGTHSKWVKVEGGKITGFETFMTGELFEVLSQHSILASDTTATSDDAFARGVAAAERGLSASLFTTRALTLACRLDAPHDYLSGLLIGDELRCGLAVGADDYVLIGDPALVGRYQRALAVLGRPTMRALDTTAPRGLLAVARAADLVEPR